MHTTDHLVIHCIDFRFRKQIADWIESELGEADLIVLAGASKAIIDADTQTAVLKQLYLARELHGITTVHILDHIDCGAYGGSKEHQTKEQEVAMHQIKLAEAQNIISDAFTDLKVKKYIVDVNAVVSAE